MEPLKLSGKMISIPLKYETISVYLASHGVFTGRVETVDRLLREHSRNELAKMVAKEAYEGSNVREHATAKYWKQYTAQILAVIYADTACGGI